MGYKSFLAMIASATVGHSMELEWYGEKYEIKLSTRTYVENGNLAIQLHCKNTEEDGVVWWEPFATLTTNTGKKHNGNLATIDTNNCPFAEELIEKYCLGKHAGMMEFSGFCAYPVYDMNTEALKWFGLNEG